MESYDLERLGRHFLTFLLIGVICYVSLALFGQGEKFWSALLDFPLAFVPLLLCLALLNYLLRYIRWHIYLKALGIRIAHWRSFQIFFAGLTMTVTPGKVGEALKGHLLKRQGDNPWSKGLPIVFAERLTDLLGVVILVSMGLNVLPAGRGLALIGMAVCFLLILVFVHPNVFRALSQLLGKIPRMAGRREWLLEMHGNIKRLMTPQLVLVAVIISCIAWFSECLVLYFALSACGFEANWLRATFIYASSTLAGAISILPGGLVATEGSMTGMLLLFDLERNQAASVTFIVRLCTLWLAVFLGVIFLFFLERSLRANRSQYQREKRVKESSGDSDG